jgi:hypothetical protein
MTAFVFVVAGTPGSRKDELVRAVGDLADRHAHIVPKHTSRARQSDDGREMICAGNPGCDLESCDLTYTNFETIYGIKTATIWNGIVNMVSQVLVVSDETAIAALMSVFGGLVRLIYIHSVENRASFLDKAKSNNWERDYTDKRKDKYWQAFDLYVRNIYNFDHVLIHAVANEDLYDQIFRLFRAYEHGDLT